MTLFLKLKTLNSICMLMIQLCVIMLLHVKEINEQLTNLYIIGLISTTWFYIYQRHRVCYLGTVQRLRNVIDNMSVGEDEFTITVGNTHKLSGLHVDNSLTWDMHVAFTISKVRRRLHMLNNILSLQYKSNFYNGELM